MAILFYQVHTHAKLKDKLFSGELARIYDNNDCDKVQYQLQCENQFFFKQFYYYHLSNNIRLPF